MRSINSKFSKSDGSSCDRCQLTHSTYNKVRISPWWNPSEPTWMYLCEDCVSVVNNMVNRGEY